MNSAFYDKLAVTLAIIGAIFMGLGILELINLFFTSAAKILTLLIIGFILLISGSLYHGKQLKKS